MTIEQAGNLALVVAIGYLVGSVPSGLLIGRWLRGIDIRTIGSGRTGATNVMRGLGPRGFILTFAADTTKAVMAVLLGGLIVADPELLVIGQSLGGLAAIVGHNWSIFIRFSGGRGVACSFGAMLVLHWQGALAGILIAATVIALTRYVSLGSLVGTIGGLLVTAGGVALFAAALPLAAFAGACAVIVIVQHRDNIDRLFRGTERRLGRG